MSNLFGVRWFPSAKRRRAKPSMASARGAREPTGGGSSTPRPGTVVGPGGRPALGPICAARVQVQLDRECESRQPGTHGSNGWFGSVGRPSSPRHDDSRAARSTAWPSCGTARTGFAFASDERGPVALMRDVVDHVRRRDSADFQAELAQRVLPQLMPAQPLPTCSLVETGPRNGLTASRHGRLHAAGSFSSLTVPAISQAAQRRAAQLRPLLGDTHDRSCRSRGAKLVASILSGANILTRLGCDGLVWSPIADSQIRGGLSFCKRSRSWRVLILKPRKRAARRSCGSATAWLLA